MSEFTVEGVLSPEIRSRIEAIQKDQSAASNPAIKVIKDREAPVELRGPDIVFGDDTPPADGDTPPADGDTPPVAMSPEIAETLKKSGMTEEQLFAALADKQKITIKIAGKDRKMALNDIRSMLGREEVFQRKHDKLVGSDEYKLGVLMKAAKDGDKGALKKAQALLMEAAKTDDFTDYEAMLMGVKDDFDAEKAAEKAAVGEPFEAVFEDVKDSLDFEENMSKMETDLRGRIPPKVYKAYWETPENRRAMYDLVASGRMTSLLDKFDEELAKLPFERQLAVESDPDVYGQAFLAMAKRMNAAKQAPKTKPVDPDDGMRSVSNGSRGRNTGRMMGAAPDFASMTRAEFLEWQRKNGLAT